MDKLLSLRIRVFCICYFTMPREGGAQLAKQMKLNDFSGVEFIKISEIVSNGRLGALRARRLMVGPQAKA